MNWMKLYRSKVTDAATAVRTVFSGSRLYLGGGAAVPQSLVQALVERADELRDVEIVHMLHFGPAPYTAPQYAASFRHNAVFIGANVRKAVQAGRADLTPIFLSEVPKLFQPRRLPLDVAFVQLSSPDEHGFCSFGTEVGCTKPAAEAARVVIAEVNRQMPHAWRQFYSFTQPRCDRRSRSSRTRSPPRGRFTGSQAHWRADCRDDFS
jgi:acetyl-CoA hydrolase